jgi:protein NRD1
MLTAPYGGSGGRPIVGGLSVEEPDIEIGAGVSSKAISRRMQTDKGGNHGPKSSRHAEDEPPVGFGGHANPQAPGHGHMGGAPVGPTNSAANNPGGPPGGRWRHKGADKHHGGGGGRDARRGGDDRNDGHHNNKGGNADEPIVMDLPAGITMGPNGINYPPNFSFGAAASHP